MAEAFGEIQRTSNSGRKRGIYQILFVFPEICTHIFLKLRGVPQRTGTFILQWIKHDSQFFDSVLLNSIQQFAETRLMQDGFNNIGTRIAAELNKKVCKITSAFNEQRFTLCRFALLRYFQPSGLVNHSFMIFEEFSLNEWHYIPTPSILLNS